MSRWGLLVLAVMTASSPAANSVDIEITPAWDGMTRAGAASEIGLRVVAGFGGELVISLDTPSTRVSQSATLIPDIPLLLHLPVPATATDKVVIETDIAGTAVPEREVMFRQLPPEQPVVAAVGQFPDPWKNPGDLSVIRPGVASLPYRDWSYSVIDLLVINRVSLQRLSDSQIDALQGYLAACGRLIAYRTSPQVFDLLTTRAGCNGRLMAAADTSGQLYDHVDALLKDSPPALPSMASLRSLLPQQNLQRNIVLLTVFFCVYFLILLATVHTRYGNKVLPAIPALALLLGLYAWSDGTVQARLVNWAETESGSQSVRYSALLETRGSGHGKVEFTLPRPLGLPDPVQTPPIELAQQQADDAGMQLAFPARLFSRHEFGLHGSFAVQPALVLGHTGKHPAIDNRSTQYSPSSVLAWRDQKYSVPALPPGARWIPEHPAEPWSNTGVEQVFREQALGDEAALLLPYSLSDAGIVATGSAASGYLMVRQ